MTRLTSPNPNPLPRKSNFARTAIIITFIVFFSIFFLLYVFPGIAVFHSYFNNEKLVCISTVTQTSNVTQVISLVYVKSYSNGTTVVAGTNYETITYATEYSNTTTTTIFDRTC